MAQSQKKASVCILCGPSGVGKGTLLNNVKDHFADNFAVAVSHTTRKQRPREVNGIDYHFVTREQFQEGINKGEFVEYADVFGNYYGTSISAIHDVQANNLICILEIDVQGAKIIRDAAKISANYLFITCEGGIKTLEKRMMHRNTENLHEIATRLDTARKELQFLDDNPKFFECIISNDELLQSTQRLIQQFEAWYPSIVNPSTDEKVDTEQIASCPIVICGPSGVGKGTLLKRVKDILPNTFGVACSHTTRKARPGEINAVHYNFISKEHFEKGINDKQFVEYAQVNDNYYGTSYKGIELQEKKNLICMLEIDVQGADIIQQSGKLKAHYLFITCDGGINTLKQRLMGRKTETKEQIQKRLQTAEKEFKFLESKKDFFGCVISNDDLEESAQKLVQQLKEWYPWLVTDNLDEEKANLVISQQSAEGLFNALQFDGASVYDTRSKADYDACHAFGAIYAPAVEVMDAWDKLANKRIFVYGGDSEKIKRLYAIALKLNVIQFCVITDDFAYFKKIYPFLCTDQNITQYPNCVPHTSHRLYVGAASHAFDVNVIKNLGITHIVNTKGTPTKLDQDIAKTIQYFDIKIEDSAEKSALEFFDKCSDFVDNALKEKDTNRVLIHCGGGKSRSSTFTIAYLIKYRAQTLAFAYGIMTIARPKAFPNDGFLDDLGKYEMNVYGSSTKHFITNSVLRDKTQWKKVLASWKIDL